MDDCHHIVVVIPLPYRRNGDFWGRDAGLLVRGFRELGLRATLVTLSNQEPLGEKEGYEKEGLVVAGLSNLESSDWWKTLSPDGVILFGWTLSRFQKVRNAILTVTSRLAERMDTNGMRSAILNPARYFYLTWAQSMDRMEARNCTSWKTLPSGLFAALWTARSLVGLPIIGARAAKTVGDIPLVMVESPLAKRRIDRWLRFHGHEPSNVHFCPHAVDIAELPKGPATKKRPDCVIAVGRWGSFQKDFDLTWKIACRFVSERKGAEFHIVGEVPWKTPVVPRVVLHGRLGRGETGQLLAASRILFAASRYESFHLAAAEALCCGCSVVLSENVPTARWFVGEESGTLARTPAYEDLLVALKQEASLWETGARSPDAIATFWRSRLSPSVQAKSILELWS